MTIAEGMRTKRETPAVKALAVRRLAMRASVTPQLGSFDLPRNPRVELAFRLAEELRVPVVRCWPFGKFPNVGPGGWHNATTDSATIASWWQEIPSSNVGAPAGDLFTIVDLDYKTAAQYSNEIRTLYFAALTTCNLVVQTPRGWHYYFAGGVTTDIGALPGVDVLGHGNCPIMPTSLRYAASPLSNDQMYRVARAPLLVNADNPYDQIDAFIEGLKSLKPLPQVFVDLLEKREREGKRVSIKEGLTDQTNQDFGGVVNWFTISFHEIGAFIASIPEGTRHNELIRGAGMLFRRAYGGWQEPDSVHAALKEACSYYWNAQATQYGHSRPFPDRELQSILRDARKWGMAKPLFGLAATRQHVDVHDVLNLLTQVEQGRVACIYDPERSRWHLEYVCGEEVEPSLQRFVMQQRFVMPVFFDNSSGKPEPLAHAAELTAIGQHTLTFANIPALRSPCPPSGVGL